MDKFCDKVESCKKSNLENNAMVRIVVSGIEYNPSNPEDIHRTSTSAGSGFILDHAQCLKDKKYPWIVTAYHVISGARNINISFPTLASKGRT